MEVLRVVDEVRAAGGPGDAIALGVVAVRVVVPGHDGSPDVATGTVTHSPIDEASTKP